MAVRKTPRVEMVPPEAAARAASLEGSVAATKVRPGFTLAPAYDLMFAAGFPHMVWLTEETPREDPVEVTLKAFGHQRDVAWPRTIAHRFARLFLAKVRGTMNPATGQGIFAEESRDLAAREDPFTEAEAKRVLRDLFVTKGRIYNNPPLYVMEALLGADFIATACVEALGFLLPGDLNDWDVYRCAAVHQLAFVLRRAPPDLARDAREQLQAMYVKGAAHWPHGAFERDGGSSHGFLTAQLDVILHGVEGARRSGHRIGEHLAPWSRLFTDDASEHAKPLEKPGPWAQADAQLVWLGGDPPFEWQLTQWKKFTQPGEHARLVESLGPIRDGRVKLWLEVMSKESKAKKAAALWLERHRLAEASA